MKILSWDVGIYNLAYCLIEYSEKTKNCKILDWNIINLRKDVDNAAKQNIIECDGLNNKKIGKIIYPNTKKCNNKAKFIHKSSDKHYCLRHAKKHHKSISIDTACNKTFDTTFKLIKIKKPKKKKIKIHELGKNLIVELNKYPEFLNIDYVLIENQPVLKNPTMKSVQMILYSYFLINGLIKNTIKEIKFISARNKLKIYDGPPIEVKVKGKYAKRKRLSIEHCRYMINDNETNLQFFNEHKKKDDLADSYLQAIWFLKKSNII